MALQSPDLKLIEAARSIIRERFKPNFHHVGAALRTQSGQIFAAVHLEANVGRIAVCAEAIALGMAAATGDTNVESIVAVDRNGNVVSPCGMCRELISDYSPDARVIVPGKGSAEVLSIRDLLPQKYIRNET
jgi:cytidine deaminase